MHGRYPPTSGAIVKVPPEEINFGGVLGGGMGGGGGFVRTRGMQPSVSKRVMRRCFKEISGGSPSISSCSQPMQSQGQPGTTRSSHGAPAAVAKHLLTRQRIDGTPSPHVLRARQAPRSHSPRLPSAARQALPSAKAVHGSAETSATAGWWQVLGPAACCRTQCGRHEAALVTWMGVRVRMRVGVRRGLGLG